MKCTACSYKGINNDSPIVPALDGKGLPDANQTPAMIPIKDLPACPECGGLLRPDIVWFGEMPLFMDEIYAALWQADLFISIGTSGNVYPAAGFVKEAQLSGTHTVEINLQPSLGQSDFAEKHYGKAGTLVPKFVENLLQG